jgi:nucleoside-diphosphate-sugar epimerase
MMEGKVGSIAIVGGGGFVGSTLARHLSKRFNIRVLDLRAPSNFDGNFVSCDIRDKSSLETNLGGMDLVINTAVVQIPNINENKRLGFEVNVLGVQNICEAVESIGSLKGLIHTGSWHVFGESGLTGRLNESFGYHPDNIEERARFYALTKIAQESIIRIVGGMSDKSYNIFRLGTVLGDGMPSQTAANLFIESALKGEPITPYRHTQHRQMLYVDVLDVCRVVEKTVERVFKDELRKGGLIVNLFSPPPITIIELAKIVQSKSIKLSKGKIRPKIEVVDKGSKPLYHSRDTELVTVDASKFRELLGARLTDPRSTIERLLANRMMKET